MREKSGGSKLLEGDETNLGRIFSGWLILDYMGGQPRVVTTAGGLNKHRGAHEIAIKYNITMSPPKIPEVNVDLTLSTDRAFNIVMDEFNKSEGEVK